MPCGIGFWSHMRALAEIWRAPVDVGSSSGRSRFLKVVAKWSPTSSFGGVLEWSIRGVVMLPRAPSEAGRSRYCRYRCSSVCGSRCSSTLFTCRYNSSPSVVPDDHAQRTAPAALEPSDPRAVTSSLPLLRRHAAVSHGLAAAPRAACAAPAELCSGVPGLRRSS